MAAAAAHHRQQAIPQNLMPTSALSSLFTPLTLGAFELAHRVVMSTPPRRRARAHGIPTALMALHHGQRASAGGLMIGEATAVRRDGLVEPDAPGLFSSEQANLWRQVTDAVHERGGIILAQLAQQGRGGAAALPAGAATLDLLIESFRDAAENASDAGFDGVELQAGEGGWIEQLLRSSPAPEEGAAAVVDLLQALGSVWGADRVGISLAASDGATHATLLPEVQRLGLAYLRLPGLAAPGGLYGGAVLGSGNAGAEQAAAALARRAVDAFAFELAFVANPDLPERLRRALPLAQHDPATLGHGGARGYTDYPGHSTGDTTGDTTGPSHGL
jgi:N-ethylmaleimide reductase